MATELIRYENGKPVIQDGLIADDVPLHCDRCRTEYRVHYSQGEANQINGVSKLRSIGLQKVHSSHSEVRSHPDSLPLP